MGPPPKEQFCEGKKCSVMDSLCVVEHSRLDPSDYSPQPLPKNVHAGGDHTPQFPELSKLTHHLVAVVVALCVLVVGLVLGNVQLQMRVSGLEEMVSRMKSELDALVQMTPATDFDQKAKWPISDGQHSVTPLMAGRVPTWLQQSGRRKRNAGTCKNFPVRELMNKYCEDLKAEKNKSADENQIPLQVALFEAVFDSASIDAHLRNPNRDGPNCFNNSMEVELCAGSTIKYPKEGMRLHVYSSKDRDNGNIAVLKDNVSFVIKTDGIYLVNLNVSFIDNTFKGYLGLYVNNRILLACPEGGIKCSTNIKGRSEYRICNINGVLKLNVNDTIDVRTMQRNTLIWIFHKSNSYFTIALLQRL